MAELYCFRCGEKIKYAGGGSFTCAHCGYVKYMRECDSETLDLHSKAEFYLYDGQYFNALKMYEILLKKDGGDYAACFGALLSEYGARFEDKHDGSFVFLCERTQSTGVYESEYYKKLCEITPSEVLSAYGEIIENIDQEQKKNNEQYLATAPIDEERDYRKEAQSADEELADDYLSARERYLEAERKEREEAEQRRLEAKERAEAAQKARENRALLEAARAKKKKKIIVASGVVLALALLIVLVFTLIIPAVRYGLAQDDIAAGNYDAAARTLRELGDFSDSKMLADKYRLYGLKAGESVIFGEYEQDGNAGNGKEDIEWIVLKSDDSTVTLMSKYVLDCVKYHENKDKPSYWSEASLRKWLNEDFLNTAFSDAEQAFICEIENQNPNNDEHKTVGGETTLDRVYILSIDEVKAYVGEDIILGVPTAYAISRGTYQKDGFEATYWWLRSPGATQNNAAFVSYEGKLTTRGSNVDYSSYGVRVCVTLTKAEIK